MLPSRKTQRNDRSSGSLCSEAARDPESVRAGIGTVEAGERDPRRERVRNEFRGPEIGSERIPVWGRDDGRNFVISSRAVSVHEG